MTCSEKDLPGQMSIEDWLNGPDSPDLFAGHMGFAPVPSAPEKKPIEDFGEKIGGARKDLWDGGNLATYNDIKKSDIWKKPDYEKLYACCRPRELCWFIKRVYDSIPSRPKMDPAMAKADQTAVLNRYASMVSQLEQQCMSITALEDIKEFGLNHYLEDNGLIIMSYHTYMCMGYSRAFVTTRLVNTLLMTPQQIRQEAKKKRFLYTADEKILADCKFIQVQEETEVKADPDKKERLEIISPYKCGSVMLREYFYSANAAAADASAYKKGTWFAARFHRIEMCGFATKEEAQEYILSAARSCAAADTSAPGKKRKKAFKFPHLEHVIRSGGRDFRKGRDVTGEDYLDVFHFRGGEFGNWLPQGERQEVLNQGYDAFMDMASVLGISPEKLTGDGKLAIAFGARGRGRALAHFEPGLCVINITRMRGAGSLGHEMTHFFDYLCGRNLGFSGYLTSHTYQSPESFKKLMEAIKGKTDNRTKFYKDAVKIDGSYSKSSKGYWRSDVELLARAGAAYFKDRLEAKGIRNDYLCGHADSVVIEKGSEKIYGAPQGEERELINERFDEFFHDMKTQGILG